MSKPVKFIVVPAISLVITFLLISQIFRSSIDSASVIDLLEQKYKVSIEVKQRKTPFWAIFSGISFHEVKVFRKVANPFFYAGALKENQVTTTQELLLAIDLVKVQFNVFDAIFNSGEKIIIKKALWKNPQFTLQVSADKKTNLEELFLTTTSAYTPRGLQYDIALKEIESKNLFIENGLFKIEIAQAFSYEKKLIVLKEVQAHIKNLIFHPQKTDTHNKIALSSKFRIIYDNLKSNYFKNVETIDWLVQFSTDSAIFDRQAQLFFYDMAAKLTFLPTSRTVGLSNVEAIRSPFFALNNYGIKFNNLKRELILTKEAPAEITINQFTIGVKQKTNFEFEEFQLSLMPNSYIDLFNDKHLWHQEILFQKQQSDLIVEQVGNYFANINRQYADKSRQFAREYLKDSLKTDEKDSGRFLLESENTENFYYPQIRLIQPILTSAFGWYLAKVYQQQGQQRQQQALQPAGE